MITMRICKVCEKELPIHRFREYKVRNDYTRFVGTVKYYTRRSYMCIYCESLKNKAKYQEQKIKSYLAEKQTKESE